MKRLLRALFTLLVPVFAFGQGSNVPSVSGSDIGPDQRVSHQVRRRAMSDRCSIWHL